MSTAQRMVIQQNMERIASFYYASASIQPANHSDFFNSHRRLHSEPKRFALPAPTIVNVEFKSRIRWKNLRDFAQAFGHCSRSQQRIVALAQIVVIDVEIEREQVGGSGIREAGCKILGLEFLRGRGVAAGRVARRPGAGG